MRYACAEEYEALLKVQQVRLRFRPPLRLGEQRHRHAQLHRLHEDAHVCPSHGHHVARVLLLHARDN